MSVNATSSKSSSPALSRWRLWVDGCGGFLLLAGSSWSVGGWSQRESPDICVRADWPRHAGKIEREGEDYFWNRQPSGKAHSRDLIGEGQTLPISGSAALVLRRPSPLCESAVLQLKPPHRFDQHVDGVVLVNETLLVGPTLDCHIRCRESSDRAVMTRRGDQWMVKAGLSGNFEELRPGQRMTLHTLAMTLEEA